MARTRIIDGSKFGWNQRRGFGAANASDLVIKAGEYPQCFYIMSQNTGQQKLFLYSSSRINNENELQWVDYICPGGGLTVRIFND